MEDAQYNIQVSLLYKQWSTVFSTIMVRIKEAKSRNAGVIDVDGSYLHQKHQQLINSSVSVAPPGIPPRPLASWVTITNSNYQQYCTKIPIVT